MSEKEELLREIEQTRSRLAALERQLDVQRQDPLGGNAQSVSLSRLSKLAELSLMISGDPADVCEQVVRAIGELFKVRIVCLSEFAGDELHFRFVYVNGQMFRDAGSCPLAEVPCATDGASKGVGFFDRVRERFPRAVFLKDHDKVACYSVPSIDAVGAVVAVMYLLHDQPHAFAAEDHAVLHAFGQRIAIEIERDRHLAERAHLEQAMAVSEQRLRDTLDSLVLFVGLFTPDGVFLEINRLPLEMAGLMREDAIGKCYRDTYWASDVPEGWPIVRDALTRAAQGEIVRTEVPVRIAQGRILTLDAYFNAIRDRNGRVLHIVGSGIDITERKQAEGLLRKSESRLREAEQLAGLGNWELDLTTNRLVWSDQIFHIFEIDSSIFEASYKAFLRAIHPDDRRMVNEAYVESVRKRMPYAIVHRLLMPDGRVKYVQERGETLYDMEGRPLRSIGTVQDITDRRMAELKVEQALHEKELLLRELHHRVKNNLQLVSSLLHFQSKKISDSAGQTVFREGQDRLRSMILVHEKLYQSNDLARIDFGGYVQALAEGVISSYGMLRSKIEMKVDVAEVDLPVEIAMPAGMIVNELLTNALKYAFPDGRGGAVQIRAMVEDGQLEMRVEDNGVGLPGGMNVEQPVTFGLQLVQGLVVQLGGTICYEQAQGTSVCVFVPLPVYAGR